MESNLKEIIFSGKTEDYRRWSSRFLAYATMKGWNEVLTGGLAVPDYNKQLDPTNDTEEIKARKYNSEAYSMLILSCGDDPSFNVVDTAKTRALPYGDAKKAWEDLKDAYEPKDQLTEVELLQAFYECKLTDDMNPDEWFAKMEYYRQRLKEVGHTLLDGSIIAHAISTLPESYNSYKALFNMRLKDSANRLQLAEMKSLMRTAFKDKEIKSNDKSEDDIGLIGKDSVKGQDKRKYNKKLFKGRCNECGSYGHKAVDCRKKETASFKGTCHNCGIYGHKSTECRKPKNYNHNKERTNGNKTQESADLAFNHLDVGLLNNEKKDIWANYWIADSGATSHLTNDDTYLYDVETSKDDKITIGDGSKMTVVKKGKLKVKTTDEQGKDICIELHDVKYVPELWCNLFSLTRAMSKGAVIRSKGMQLIVSNGNKTTKFEVIMRNGDQVILGARFLRMKNYINYEELQRGTTLSIMDLHERLGHVSINTTKKTAKEFEWNLTGETLVCESCAMAKARQANISKDNKQSTKRPGEKLYMDISKVQTESIGGRKFWLLLVDEFTKFKKSIFLKQKSETKDAVMKYLGFLKARGVRIETIRCDNAWENKKLEEALNKDGWGIKFEYTAPNTPQQNGIVERAFASLYSRARSMMIGAGLNTSQREKLWAEAVNTATDMDNLIVTEGREKPPHELFMKEMPKYARHLRTFGEMAIVAKRDTLKSKLGDRGKKCMFLGYSHTHAGNVYRMLDINTKKVILSRDIIWMNKLYGKDTTYKGKLLEEFVQDTQDNEEKNESLKDPVIQLEGPE